MINHLNLTYFITAAREQNITRAAEKLFISQQALSNHIAAIEKETGVVLFERKQSLKLTYAGKAFFKYAVSAVEAYESMLQEMSDIREDKKGELTLGISHTRGRMVLPRVLPKFIDMYPQVEVHVLEGNTEELSKALDDGDIDIAVGSPGVDTEGIVCEELMQEDVVLGISEKLFDRYPLEMQWKIRSELTEQGRISTLRELPFLLNKSGNATRDVADTIFREESFNPHILIETENIETLGEMCLSGIGAAFYPDTLLEELIREKKPDEMNFYRLAYPCTKIPFSIGYRKSAYVTRVMKDMMDLIRETMLK